MSLTAEASVHVDADREAVWRALTDPGLIAQYLFGTQVETDWAVGSPITYSGVWEGKPYQDKGTILVFDEPNTIVSTFFSALRGKPDIPENYQNVTYRIDDAVDGGVTVTVIQDGNADEAEAAHSARNWTMVLEGLRGVVER
ncbi:SRPBCC domain-containing protein [Diaminobutyricibacter tongyongensis]|uniref:SRPBCC domain-containing protein n=1 Tax=Leifsonia tongyongensis TaxID=1268043 RepID=A0A6L9XWB7_9MICO|nr:SRPBCC family protein [Diaminobutyricibacter tongyongensis]NEN05586.1 SRPBCC domain-containing protein [Diaminobutyricibacter tongyongensis]